MDIIYDEDGNFIRCECHPERDEPTEEEIVELTPPGTNLPDEIKTYYKRSHKRHTAQLYENKHTEPNPNYSWPYYFDENTDEFSNDELEQNYWKAIKSIPGKARHNGYTLSVLGRIHLDWARSMLHLIKLSLVTHEWHQKYSKK